MATEKEHCIAFLRQLQSEIITAFEELEPTHRFERKEWQHANGGGGVMALLRGATFEKAAVNWSAVSGDTFPGDDGTGPFFATGVSLITHMHNPHAPTVHMNVRYIETHNGCWFGGGYDLTPMGFPYSADTDHFHTVAKETLTPFGEELYPRFAAQARDYFYIPHRGKERGVGGIFFDHYNSGDWEHDQALMEAVGSSLPAAILPIYRRRCSLPFTAADKAKQLELRGHYAEFNLAIDRGTRFGFLSGGNTEAILCSLPPTVTW